MRLGEAGFYGVVNVSMPACAGKFFMCLLTTAANCTDKPWWNIPELAIPSNRPIGNSDTLNAWGAALIYLSCFLFFTLTSLVLAVFSGRGIKECNESFLMGHKFCLCRWTHVVCYQLTSQDEGN